MDSSKEHHLQTPNNLRQATPERRIHIGIELNALDMSAPLIQHIANHMNTVMLEQGLIDRVDDSAQLATITSANAYPDLCGLIIASGPSLKSSTTAASIPMLRNDQVADSDLWRRFIMRVLVQSDWIASAPITPKRLIEFHARHKYLVMAHSQPHYRTLGQMLSDLSNVDLQSVAKSYHRQLMAALALKTTQGQHCNALYHIKGYLKHYVSSQESRALDHEIEAYRQGQVPITHPIQQLNHHIDQHEQTLSYLKQQVYLTYPLLPLLMNEP